MMLQHGPDTKEALLEAIKSLSDKFPDWRLGQLIGNLTVATRCDYPGGVFDIEDAELLESARSLLAKS